MKIAILGIIAVVTLVAIPSAFACSPEDIQHWMNIKVTTSNILIHDTEPDLPVTIFYLPIPTNGPEIFTLQARGDIVTARLNYLGYTQEDGDPVNIFDISAVDTTPFGYSVSCDDPFMSVGGILIEPDTYTLLLAYGISNSFWMAPLAIGAGAGVYLMKSKRKRV